MLYVSALLHVYTRRASYIDAPHSVYRCTALHLYAHPVCRLYGVGEGYIPAFSCLYFSFPPFEGADATLSRANATL